MHVYFGDLYLFSRSGDIDKVAQQNYILVSGNAPYIHTHIRIYIRAYMYIQNTHSNCQNLNLLCAYKCSCTYLEGRILGSPAALFSDNSHTW
jgi:hypothetical protein